MKNLISDIKTILILIGIIIIYFGVTYIIYEIFNLKLNNCCGLSFILTPLIIWIYWEIFLKKEKNKINILEHEVEIYKLKIEK